MTGVRTFASVVALAGALVAAAPAAAVITTFATFNPIGTASNVNWANSGGSNAQGTGATFTSTATGSSNGVAPRLVSFSFLDPSLAGAFSGVTANFTLNAGLVPPQTALGVAGNTFLIQEGILGTFSFTTTAPIVFNSVFYAAGTNLLSATFSGTTVSGFRGSSSAGFNGSTAINPTTITYTSAFLNFGAVLQKDFAIGISAVTGPLNAVPTNASPQFALRNFRGVASGNFSTDPAPIVTAVPEPAVWGLMLAGFAMVGFQARRRARGTAVTA